MKSELLLKEIKTFLASDSKAKEDVFPLMASGLEEREALLLLRYLSQNGYEDTIFYPIALKNYDSLVRKNKYKKELEEKLRKKNETVETLLLWFTNLKSKKVREARKELQTRFLSFSYEEQVAVMKAFLQSGKTDRQWCYDKLRHWWSDELQSDILKVWETYKEEHCGWLITRYFPIQVLQANLSSLEYDSNYYELCKRLLGYKWFHIDKEKLKSSSDDFHYLWIMSQTEDGIPAEEAMHILFRWIGWYIHCYKDALKTGNVGFGSPIVAYYERNLVENFCMSQILHLNKMLSSLCKMGMTHEVEQFLIYDKNIHVDFMTSHEEELEYLEFETDEEEKIRLFKRLYSLYIESFINHAPADYKYDLQLGKNSVPNRKKTEHPDRKLQEAAMVKNYQNFQNSEPAEELEEEEPVYPQDNPFASSTGTDLPF